jgi:hypothetical protein
MTTALKLYWSPTREDNFSTATAVGERDAQSAGYQFVRVEGQVYESPQSNTVPLKLYWNAQRGDNFVTGTPQGEGDAIAAGYQLIRTEGYIYPAQEGNSVPLKLYWNSQRGDNFCTATAEGEQAAINAGYRLVRVEGYLPQGRAHVCLDKAASGSSLPPREIPPRPPRIMSDGSIIGSTSQPLAGATELMWNAGQTLRVKMMGGTPFVRSKVRQYAEEWTKYANVRFEFVDPSQYAEIRVAFDPDGSWSLLGRTALWIPFDFATMNFGWFTDDTPEQELSRVILHEFGHALGLIHEHQSPVSGIQWDKEKVYAFYEEADGWDRAKVDEQVFEKYKVASTNYSQYDRTSIMHYWIPGSLTLDGIGAPGNNALSVTDKDFIARWYPYPPTPENANGLIRTGDDCDEVDFLVEYGVVGDGEMTFRLAAASGLTWWKAIEVPIGASDYAMVEVQDGRSAEQTIQRADLDVSRPLRFWKAKVFGVHTRLEFTWDVLFALPGGTRLSLTWKRDRC